MKAEGPSVNITLALLFIFVKNLENQRTRPIPGFPSPPGSGLRTKSQVSRSTDPIAAWGLENSQGKSLSKLGWVICPHSREKGRLKKEGRGLLPEFQALDCRFLILQFEICNPQFGRSSPSGFRFGHLLGLFLQVFLQQMHDIFLPFGDREVGILA
jgi:hypothetical protein